MGWITRIFGGTKQAGSGTAKGGSVPTVPEMKELAKIIPEMRKDYQVTFCEGIIAANVAAVQVTIGTDDARLTSIAEKYQDLWDATAKSMLDAVAYGRVAYEAEWHDAGGYQCIDNLCALPFELTEMRLRDGRYNGIRVRLKEGHEDIEAVNSWWLALDATMVRPHGKSRFLPAPYEVFRERSGAKENRKTALSKWALRGPVVRGPATDYDEQTQQTFDPFAEMKPAVDQWGKGGLLYLPNTREAGSDSDYTYTIEQADLQGFDPNAINAAIDRLDLEMMRAFRIPEKTAMEAAGVGTYGAVVQIFQILYAMIEEIVSQFVESFQKYVIDRTLQVNGLQPGLITASFVPLTSKPDAFVFEVLKLLLANPAMVEAILAGGVDLRELMEQAGLPVSGNLEAVLQAAAQRLQAATGTVPGMAPAASGEFGSLGRRQWQNNIKAIRDVLGDVTSGAVTDAMAKELLQSLGLPPERADALITDAKDGTVDDPEIKQPVAMAVPIPRQGFKVPTAEQVLNQGLREFDRLWNELLDAMGKKANATTLNQIRQQILDVEASMRTAGRVLGMLSPWQPRINTFADGAGTDADKAPIVKLADEFRYPWIKSAVEFLEGQGVLTADDFAKMSRQDRIATYTTAEIESPRQLRRVQATLAETLAEGGDLRSFRKKIGEELALTRAQTETLYRTQTKRGYVAGMESAFESPTVREEFPAVMYAATADTRVRDEHWDLDGVVVMRNDTRAFNVLQAAASDYNCRCGLIPLSLAEAEAKGVSKYSDLPASARAKYG